MSAYLPNPHLQPLTSELLLEEYMFGRRRQASNVYTSFLFFFKFHLKFDIEFLSYNSFVILS